MKIRASEALIMFLGIAFVFCLCLIIAYSPEKQYDFYIHNTKSATYADGTFEDLKRAIDKSNNYQLFTTAITIDGVNMLLSYNDYLKYREFMKEKNLNKNKIEKEW